MKESFCHRKKNATFYLTIRFSRNSEKKKLEFCNINLQFSERKSRYKLRILTIFLAVLSLFVTFLNFLPLNLDLHLAILIFFSVE